MVYTARAGLDRKYSEGFKFAGLHTEAQCRMVCLWRLPLDEIVSIILETVCSKRKTIRIAGDDYPAELVKAKFMKLNSSHIEFVFDCMKENTTKIRNIKQYLKAVLFNAPNTIDSYDIVNIGSPHRKRVFSSTTRYIPLKRTIPALRGRTNPKNWQSAAQSTGRGKSRRATASIN